MISLQTMQKLKYKRSIGLLWFILSKIIKMSDARVSIHMHWDMVVYGVACCSSLYVAGCFMFLVRHVLDPSPKHSLLSDTRSWSFVFASSRPHSLFSVPKIRSSNWRSDFRPLGRRHPFLYRLRFVRRRPFIIFPPFVDWLLQLYQVIICRLEWGFNNRNLTYKIWLRMCLCRAWLLTNINY